MGVRLSSSNVSKLSRKCSFQIVDPKIEEGEQALLCRVAGMVGAAHSDVAGAADQSVVLGFVGATETRRDHVVDRRGAPSSKWASPFVDLVREPMD